MHYMSIHIIILCIDYIWHDTVKYIYICEMKRKINAIYLWNNDTSIFTLTENILTVN